MIAVVAAVADWLKGPEGIAAALAAMPRLEGDERTPEVPIVLDTYRDDEATTLELPGLPALIVRPAGPTAFEGEVATTFLSAETASVEVLYLTVAGGYAAGFREAAYVLQALDRSLTRFLADEPAGRQARTEKLGLWIVGATRRVYAPLADRIGDAALGGAYLIDFTLRNEAP